MVSIPACHAGDRGSIPRQRGLLFLCFWKSNAKYGCIKNCKYEKLLIQILCKQCFVNSNCQLKSRGFRFVKSYPNFIQIFWKMVIHPYLYFLKEKFLEIRYWLGWCALLHIWLNFCQKLKYWHWPFNFLKNKSHAKLSLIKIFQVSIFLTQWTWPLVFYYLMAPSLSHSTIHSIYIRTVSS